MSESKRIAEALTKVLALNSLEQKKLLNHTPNHTIKLTENVSMKWSSDCLSVYLFKNFPDQSRMYLKVVPALGDLENEQYEEILAAQPWVCL